LQFCQTPDHPKPLRDATDCQSFVSQVSSEGLWPSDSPTRSLARHFVGALRSRGSLAALVRDVARPSRARAREQRAVSEWWSAPAALVPERQDLDPFWIGAEPVIHIVPNSRKVETPDVRQRNVHGPSANPWLNRNDRRCALEFFADAVGRLRAIQPPPLFDVRICALARSLTSTASCRFTRGCAVRRGRPSAE
jgi:hypothetical protein